MQIPCKQRRSWEVRVRLRVLKCMGLYNVAQKNKQVPSYRVVLYLVYVML